MKFLSPKLEVNTLCGQTPVKRLCPLHLLNLPAECSREGQDVIHFGDTSDDLFCPKAHGSPQPQVKAYCTLCEHFVRVLITSNVPKRQKKTRPARVFNQCVEFYGKIFSNWARVGKFSCNFSTFFSHFDSSF